MKIDANNLVNVQKLYIECMVGWMDGWLDGWADSIAMTGQEGGQLIDTHSACRLLVLGRKVLTCHQEGDHDLIVERNNIYYVPLMAGIEAEASSRQINAQKPPRRRASKATTAEASVFYFHRSAAC